MNAAEYKKLFEVEEEHWWYRTLHRLVLRVVASEYERSGSLMILDAGCGTGRICQLLSTYGTVLGCDSSDIALDFCRERGVGNVIKADLNTADLGNGTYDVITSLDVLYHADIISEDVVLKSFHAALRPGGILLINLPAFQFLMSSHDRAVHTRHRYRHRELAEMLKRNGFEVQVCTYRLCALFPFMAAFRLLRAYFDRDTPQDVISSDIKPLSPLLNRTLELCVALEGFLIGRLPLPFGLSLFAVARKPLPAPAGISQ